MLLPLSLINKDEYESVNAMQGYSVVTVQQSFACLIYTVSQKKFPPLNSL